MNELFEKFARGEVPNFIELMEAISEISEMWPADVCLDCRPENFLKHPPTRDDTNHQQRGIRPPVFGFSFLTRTGGARNCFPPS